MGNSSEKIAQKMAYLNKQINQAITKLESQFDELSTAVYSDKEPSGTFTPANEADFKLRFTKEEYESKRDAFDRQVAYIQECVSELDRCTDALPPVDHYDDEFVDDFVSRVAKLNTNKSVAHSRQPMRFFSFAAVEQPKSGGEQLTSTYKISDFDCKTDGGTLVAKVPPEYYKYTKLLAQGMEVFAKKLGHSGKFQINSGYRTKAYDKKVGGNGNGLHCYAAAADIQIPKGTSKMSAFNTAAQCGFSGVIIYPGTGHIHVDVRKQVDAKKSSYGTTYYSTNGAKSGTSAPSGAVDTVEGVDLGGVSGGGSGSGSGGSGGSPGDYYGPTEPIKLVERTPDPEISKVIVPNGMANWNTMASALGVTVATLKKLNPAVVALYSGTTLYIPTSAVSQARQLSTKAKNSVYAYSRYASFAAVSFSETHRNYMASAQPVSFAVTKASNQENTPFQTFRNNKEYIKIYDMKELEGKKEAFISIEYNGKVRRIETLISPVSFSETHSNSINVHQTEGGWFISRHGENPVQVSISGYMLDTKLAPEKHAFMLEFENYMTDKVNKSTGEYENNAIIKLTVEGVEYQGHITSVTFNKDASRPLLYSFSMSFTCLYYKNLRNISESLGILNSRSTDQNGRSLYVGRNLMNTMRRN